MRFFWTARKLGVGLCRDEVGASRILEIFHQSSIMWSPWEDESVFLENIMFIWAHFVAMTVAVGDCTFWTPHILFLHLAPLVRGELTIQSCDQRIRFHISFLWSEAECSSFVYCIVLVRKIVNKGCSISCKFSGGGIYNSTNVSGKFYHRKL